MKQITLLLYALLVTPMHLLAADFKLNQDQYVSREIKRTLNGIDASHEKKGIVEAFLKDQLSQSFPLILKFAQERKIKSETEAEQIGFMLMSELRSRSVQVLLPSEQTEVLILSLKLTEKMTPFECSRFMRKQRTDDLEKGREILAIATELDVKDLRSYTELHRKALELLLTKKGKATALSNERREEARRSFANLIKSKSETDPHLGELKKGRTFDSMSDNAVCESGRALLRILLTKDRLLSDRVVLYLQGNLI